MCINAGMLDCPASDQSGTGMKKKLTMPGPVQYQADVVWHFFGLLPALKYERRHADASVSLLDANAQLCWLSQGPTVLLDKGASVRSVSYYQLGASVRSGS
jgi:hypothetical protein